MKQFTKREWSMFIGVRFTVLLFYIAIMLYSLTVVGWYVTLFFSVVMIYIFVFETISLYRYNKGVRK